MLLVLSDKRNYILLPSFLARKVLLIFFFWRHVISLEEMSLTNDMGAG